MIRIAVLALLLAAPAAAQPYSNATRPVPIVPHGVEVQPGPYMAGCLAAAALAHDVPAGLLLALLRVEGGTLGRISPNISAPPDIGPMQVNARRLPKLAERWGVSRERAFLAVRDSFCANVEAGAWILGLAIRDGGKDFMRGVGFYHSRTPEYHARYMKRVRAALRDLLHAGRESPAPEIAPCKIGTPDRIPTTDSTPSSSPSSSSPESPTSPGPSCAPRSPRPS